MILISAEWKYSTLTSGGFVMLKKIIILSALIIIWAGILQAQTEEPAITGKGLKLGFGISNLKTNYDVIEPLIDFKIGFHGGAFLTYQLSPKISIQPELLFAVKGTNQGGILNLLDWASNYIEFPILVKYNFPTGRAVKPILYAGPSFSYLTSSEFKVIFVDVFDVTEGMKRFDFGLVFGAGLDYKKITFDMRYTLGFANIIDSDKINAITEAEPDDLYYMTDDPEIKNSFISFMLGFKF